VETIGAGKVLSLNTLSEDDETWHVRLQIIPTAPRVSRTCIVWLAYPSLSPVLTRRVPLAFLQQLFNSNWNSRNYLTVDFSDTNIVVSVDPQLASYYKLPIGAGYDLSQKIPFYIDWGLTISNATVAELILSVNSSSGGDLGLPDPMAYVMLSARVVGVDGNPIELEDYELDVRADVFNLAIKFLLTTTYDWVPVDPAAAIAYRHGYVSFRANEQDDILSELSWDSSPIVKHFLASKLQDARPQLIQYLNSFAVKVGAAVTPWLLGADFDVVGVRYDPKSTQPTPEGMPEGDLIIDYAGEEVPAGSGLGTLHSGVNVANLAATPNLTSRVLAITSPAHATVSSGTSTSLVFAATGGTSPYTWHCSGPLPSGLAFVGDALVGQAISTGPFTLQVGVTDAVGASQSQTFTLFVNPASVSVSPTGGFPDAQAGTEYSVLAAVQGGAAPYQWSAINLPSGLTMGSSGVIDGIPLGPPGTRDVVVQVVDSQGTTAWGGGPLSVLLPRLFGDSRYCPRGNADRMWSPPEANAALGGTLPGRVQDATSPGELAKIDHIVVLMMENRSFDHMLGYLSKEGQRTDVDGLKWETTGTNTFYNYYNGRYYLPNRLYDTGIITTEAISPDHSHSAVRAQICDGMKHFVSNYAKQKVGDNPELLKLVMGYYTATELPVYDRLARDFAICDRWFCSHVGPTWPNRFVTLTGDLNRDSYGEPEVDTPLPSDFTPSEATTLFDHLTARGVEWQYFQQRASFIRAFTKYTFDTVNIREYGDPSTGFKASAKAGLKSVTFVDPLFGDLPAGVSSPQDNDDAPPSNLRDGQRFVWEVVNTLFQPASNPNWMKTMLVVVYDEHGGFYDHVEPPTNFPSLIGQSSGRLGPRVPAFVISPWTPAGLVLRDVFDHTTIAATIFRRFCSPYPPLMGPRAAMSLDLRKALSLTTPRGIERPLLGLAPNIPATTARTTERAFPAVGDSSPDSTLLAALSMMLGKGG
jgi:phospholipase C